MFKRYIIACALVSVALAYNDSRFQLTSDYVMSDVDFFNTQNGHNRDYVARKYGVDEIDGKCAKCAVQLEAALCKAIDAMDEKGINAICELVRDSGVKIALLPMLKRFEGVLSCAKRGKILQSGLATLVGAGCAYAGLKMLHKPLIQISMPVSMAANTLLAGAGVSALWAFCNVVVGKRDIKQCARNILVYLLNGNALIVGGDHAAIDGVLARILKKLS